MSSADSSFRTAYSARLKARFSTLLRKSESSFSDAKEGRLRLGLESRARLSHRTDAGLQMRRRVANRCHNAALHNSLWSLTGRPTRALCFLIAQAPHPLHKSAERCTDGFSLEKIAKVQDGYVCRGSQACRFGTTAPLPIDRA